MRVPQRNTVRITIRFPIGHPPPQHARVSLHGGELHRVINPRHDHIATFHGVGAGPTNVTVTVKNYIVAREKTVVPEKGEHRVAIAVPSTLHRARRLSEAIRVFAPLVRLHPDDHYRPASVGWYLSRVQMRFSTPARPWDPGDDQILDRGEVTKSNISKQSKDHESSGGAVPSRFFLEIPDNDSKEATRRGKSLTANGAPRGAWAMVTAQRRSKLRDRPAVLNTQMNRKKFATALTPRRFTAKL